MQWICTKRNNAPLKQYMFEIRMVAIWPEVMPCLHRKITDNNDYDNHGLGQICSYVHAAYTYNMPFYRWYCVSMLLYVISKNGGNTTYRR